MKVETIEKSIIHVLVAGAGVLVTGNTDLLHNPYSVTKLKAASPCMTFVC